MKELCESSCEKKEYMPSHLEELESQIDSAFNRLTDVENVMTEIRELLSIQSSIDVKASEEIDYDKITRIQGNKMRLYHLTTRLENLYERLKLIENEVKDGKRPEKKGG